MKKKGKKIPKEKMYIVSLVEAAAFLDTNKNLITVISGNDADWRNEYFTPITNRYGIEVEYMKLSEVSDEIKEQFSDYLDSEEIY